MTYGHRGPLAGDTSGECAKFDPLRKGAAFGYSVFSLSVCQQLPLKSQTLQTKMQLPTRASIAAAQVHAQVQNTQDTNQPHIFLSRNPQLKSDMAKDTSPHTSKN